jgi:hypothetical protein
MAPAEGFLRLPVTTPELPKIGGITRNLLTPMLDHPLPGNMKRRPNMGLFVTFSSEELEDFERWRKANAKHGEAIVIEAVSPRRPDRFKVWFARPLPNDANLSWYKPIKDVSAAKPTEQTRS